ncbi:CHAT domain-containing protein [Leptolyngbya ohadii]|uniref:CHAT domain-containing protein n=1 Tax=Leptolyngbya ohadii TaxID=1962290 RepID=UPI000B599C6E|nr:CHAT domain-containing protein [Leptolyngbya ohadii]
MNNFLRWLGDVLKRLLADGDRHSLSHRLRCFLGGLLIGFFLFCGLSFSQRAVASASYVSQFSERTHAQTNSPSIVQQGRSHYEAGQFAQAAEFWQQAAVAYLAQGDALNQAKVLGYLALAQQQLGRWEDAEQSIATSLALLPSRSSILSPTTPSTPSSTTSSTTSSTIEQQLVLAQILNTQGSLQFAQGQIEQSISTWQQAADLYTTAGSEEKRLGSLLNQAQAMQTLGLAQRAQQTLTEIERSLSAQPDSALKAMTLRSLGDVLRSTGNLAEAQRVLEQSLAIAQAVSPAKTPIILISLGNVAQSQQNTATAVRYYEQAAATAASAKASPILQLQANLNLFSLHIEAKQWQEARSLLPLLQTQIDLPPSRAAVYARINLAKSLMKFESPDYQLNDQLNHQLNHQPNYQSIAQILTPAISQAQTLKDDRAEAYAVGTLGTLYEQTQQWDAAKSLTERSLVLAQATNAADIAYQWQWQLGRILKAQNQVGQAIEAYQAAFETLQLLRRDLLATSPDLQFSFRENVEPLYRDLVELLLRRPESDRENHDRQTVSQENLRQARRIIESLQLAELDNFFRTACLEGQQIAIDQIPDTQTAVLYPIILQDRLEVILSLPGQPLQQYTAIVPQTTVEATLRELRQNLVRPFTTLRGKQLGQQVYDWMIRPIESALQAVSPGGEAITTLAFVLDGSLRNVPMAALFDGNQYLIERYSIALTPSLQIFKPQALERDRLQALLAGLTEERSGFSALANVKRELQGIEAEIPSRVLLNEAFTSDALKAQIDRNPAPIVHLATHGQFSSDAAQTFILAWDRPIDVRELGALLRSADEQQINTGLAQRQSPIELLVLSACETAEGDDRAVLGLAGVAVQSGARSTLASLWSLDDESAAELINQFYRELLNPAFSKTEALRQAQLTLLRDPNYRHPIYWAPYILVGNWL